MKFNEKLISKLGATWQYYIRLAQAHHARNMVNKLNPVDENIVLGYSLYRIAEQKLG